MKSRELLIGLLLLAIVMVDGIVLLQAAPPVGAQRWQMLLGLLTYCQFDLLVLWAVLGTRMTPARTLILAAGLGLCVVLLWNPAVLQGFRGFGVHSVVFPTHSLAFFAALVVARFRRFALIDQTVEATGAGFQLSIGRMLVWMAVIAVPLGQLQEIMVWPDMAQAMRDTWLPLTLFSSALSILSLAAAWAVLADSRPVFRFLLLAVTAVATEAAENASIDALLLRGPRFGNWTLVSSCITVSQIACLLGPLCVFRNCDYLIARCGRDSQESTKQEPPPRVAPRGSGTLEEPEG